MSSRSRSSVAQLILSAAIGFAVAHKTWRIYAGLAHRADWLYWDPSAHALYGVWIAKDLQHLHLLQLLATLNEQTLWPPLHSLIQLPFQFVIGPSFAASAFCSFAFLILTCPALTFLYHQYSRDITGWIVLMAFAASSSVYAGYGSMPMLEIFGAVLTAVSAALYLKKSRYFPISLTALFFLKYNYCLYLLMPVIALEGTDWIRSGGTVVPKMTPFRWFLVAFGVFVCVILLTGGFKIGKVSVRGVSNPIYVVLWIVIIRGILNGQLREWWLRIRGTGWEWFAVPVLIWLLIPIPNRIHTLLNFTINAPLGGQKPTQIAYYTFYLHAFASYFSTWWIAAACAAGGALTAVLLRRREILFLALLFLLPFCLMTLNQNKQDRFLFTFIFAAWMLCAAGVSAIPALLPKLAISAAVCFCCVFYYDVRRLDDLVTWPFVPLSVEQPVGEIIRQATGVDHVAILGTTNEISPALLSYHSGRRDLSWKKEKDTTRTITIVREESGNYRILTSDP